MNRTARTTTTRRAFLQASGAAAFASLAVVPRGVLAQSGKIAPNDKLRIAGIGCGGMGFGDLQAVAGEEIVALCDVDQRRSAAAFQRWGNAKAFRDFRKMFDAMENKIDAVVVATPDHFHAVAAMAAIRRKKHVYCEKPLAHSVFECRDLARAAREEKVVTQLGNQGHSTESIRLFCEWIWDGAIGKVHTIYAGCRAVNSGIDALPRLKERPPVPETLDWDQWLGPAHQRPYHTAYLPSAWRGWTPFGNGTVGDWTCHVVDPVFWALDLGAPAAIRAEVNDYDPKTQGDAFPKRDKITYEFPAKGKRGPITMIWHSGHERLPRPKELEPGRQSPETGAVVVGDRGTIIYGSHGAGGVRIIPETRMKAYQLPEKSIPRAKEHHQDWLQAIRNGGRAGSDFSYGGPLSELAMLGVIALKFPGTRLRWDAAAMRFTDCDPANAWVRPAYRTGWSL